VRGLRHVDRQWMNINERSTIAEFQRDLGDCSKAGKLDEECSRDDQRAQLAALGVAPPRV
jgi:hypothetical protein